MYRNREGGQCGRKERREGGEGREAGRPVRRERGRLNREEGK